MTVKILLALLFITAQMLVLYLEPKRRLLQCIDLAVRAQTVISLAEMSDRLKIACLFDEKTRKVTTADGKEVKPLTYGSTELS